MHQLSISFIVDCANYDYVLLDPNIQIIHHDVINHGNLSLKEYYENLHKQIANITSTNQNVLIHCYYGMCRSCSCAIAYFMWKKKYSYDEAYQLVKSKRPVCDIAYDFEMYLREYEKQLNGYETNTIKDIQYNYIVTITIPCQTSAERIIAEMYRFPNTLKDIHIGKNECLDGYYNSKEIAFEISIPLSYQEEDIEEILQDYFSNEEILSLRLDCLNE